MSYCRNNGEDSDVYVIMTRDSSAQQNILECFCDLPRHIYGTRTEMIAHLREHQQRGDKVPDRAFERLYREIGEEGDHC